MAWQQAVSRALVLALAGTAGAQIRDIDGREHALGGDPEAEATVVYFVTHDCPISNRYAPEISRICSEYSDRGVRCLLAYVDPTITIALIREHRREYGISEVAVHDSRLEIVKRAGATVTPEAALFDRLGQLAYRGRIDNLYAKLGTPRRRATEHDLRDAIDELLAGRTVSRPRTRAVGCFIPDLRTH